MAVLMKQIKPDPDSVLMGLEKEDMSVFPGCSSTFEIPFINGKPNIGLDGKENAALKKRFEDHFGVKFDTPEGLEFLFNYEVHISHDVTAYDVRDTNNLFDLHILRVNNGMGIVASSEVDIEQSPINTYKFILADETHELEQKVRTRETKTSAIVNLAKLYESNKDRLLLVAKYIFSAGAGIGTNVKLAYDKLGDFIEQSTKNAEIFLTVVKIDPDYIDTVVCIKEAINRNIIRLHNGQYVLFSTQTPLGRNEEEVIKFCSNPNNKDIVGYGMKDDLPTSIKAQLKVFED